MGDDTQPTSSDLEQLEAQLRVLRIEKKKIINKMDQARDEVTQLIDENLVIPFVEELEKAYQYFDFKEKLKKESDIEADSSIEGIHRTLVESQVLKEHFEKLDDNAIQFAIKGRIFALKNRRKVESRFQFRNWLVNHESISSGSDVIEDMLLVQSADEKFIGLSDDEKKWELKNYKLFLSLWVYSEDKHLKINQKFQKEYNTALTELDEEYDCYAATDLIYNLVLKARQASMVEQFKEMMISSHTKVLVRGVPFEASGDDVKYSFSCCGKIESVELKRLRHGKGAFITYKEPKEAHGACLLKLQNYIKAYIIKNNTIRQSPKVREKAVCVVRVFNHNPFSGSVDYCKFHDNVVDEEPTLENVEKFIRNMRDKALQKYEELASKLRLFKHAKAACGTADKEKGTGCEEGDESFVENADEVTVQVKGIITGTPDKEGGSSKQVQALVDEAQAISSMNTVIKLEDFKALDDLEANIKVLRAQKKKILKQREQVKAEVAKLIDGNLVIPFVEELEKAYQYFDFKEHLKTFNIEADSSEDRIYHALAESEVLKGRFKKVGDKDIRIAIKDAKWKEQFKKECDYYAGTNSIYDFVFKARQAKRVMDKDPNKEIEQIKESRASTHLSLVEKFKEMMMSGDTRVLSPSVDYSESHKKVEVEKFIESMRDKALEKYEDLAAELLSVKDSKAACDAGCEERERRGHPSEKSRGMQASTGWRICSGVVALEG